MYGMWRKRSNGFNFSPSRPFEKKVDIATMRSMGYSLKTIQKEINKCQVLCFNCHLKKHRQNTRLGLFTSHLD